MIKYVIVFLLQLISMFAYAQDDGKLFLSGGASYPLDPSDYYKYYNIGFNIGGGYTLPINDKFDVGGEFGFNYNGLNSDKFIEDLGGNASEWKTSGGGNTTLEFLAIGILKLSDKLNFLAGFGYYRTTFDEFTATHKTGAYLKLLESSEGKFGLNAGIKFNFDKIGLRARIHNIFTDDKTTRLFEFGLTYDIN